MAEGLDRRELTKDLDISGQANQPSRQLPLGGVMTPSGGSMSRVGEEQRTMAALMQMGGTVMLDYAKKKEDDDRLRGELDAAEGKTVQELQEQGVSTARLGGYKALKAKNALNEWELGMKQEISNKWAQEPTESFKTHLSTQFKNLRAQFEDDEDMVKLFASATGETMQSLVSDQVIKNSAYQAGQSLSSFSQLLKSEDAAGNADGLQELVDNLDTLLPNMPKEERLKSLTTGVKESLMSGSAGVYDAVGGTKGLAKMGISPEEIGSIKAAHKQYQEIDNTIHLANIDRKTAAINAELQKTGNLELAKAQYKQLQDELNLSPQFFRTQAGSVAAAEINATQEDMTKLNDSEYLDELGMSMQGLPLGGTTTVQAQNAINHLSKTYDIDRDLVQRHVEATMNKAGKYEEKQNTLLEARAKKAQENLELDNKASILVNTGFVIDQANPPKDEVIQRSFDLKRKQIANLVIADETHKTDDARQDAIMVKTVEFLKSVPQVDKRVQSDFNIASNGSPLNEQGAVRPEVQGAFYTMKAMLDSGMAPERIKEYAGSGYAYLSTAAYLGTGVTDPKLALTQAYEAVQAGTIDEQSTRSKEAYDFWAQNKEEWFDDLEPNWLNSDESDTASSQYDDVLTWQVTETMKNSPDFDAWMKQRVTQLAATYPKMKPDALVNLARADANKWEYVAGNLVRPSGTKSITEIMGLQGTPGKLVANKALIMYLAGNKDELGLGDMKPIEDGIGITGTAFDTIVESLVEAGDAVVMAGGKATGSGIPDAIIGTLPDNAIKQLEQGSITGPIKDFFTGRDTLAFVERYQRLNNNLQMMDITTTANGQLVVNFYADTDKTKYVGTKILNAKEVGDYAKKSWSAGKLEKNLPIRTPSEAPTASLSEVLEGSAMDVAPTSKATVNSPMSLKTPIPQNNEDKPRGLRNNNPGNITFSSANNWVGQTGTDGRFAIFEQPEDGIRAMQRLFLNYSKDGNNTINSIISKYAPPSENDTQSYVNAVARKIGVEPNVPIDLSDPAISEKFINAVILHENGTNPYPRQVVRAGIERGLMEDME